MSKRYTPEHRSSVLQILDNNLGNIRHTSTQTGIPERTLMDWRRKSALLPSPQQQQPQTLPPSLSASRQQNESEADDDESDEFDLLRQRLIRNLLSITQSLENNIESGSLTTRVNAVKTLMHALIELETQFVEEESGPRTIQIEYVDAVGKIYQAPPWATDEGDDDDNEFEDEDEA